jgi:molybdopterin-guanine dinucleotide biosynthesis protein A
VLAGGLGTRMGGAKASAPLDGASLLERAVAILAPHCGEVLVAGGDGAPAGARLVPDPPGPGGPLRGLLGGLRAARAPVVLVLACDLPLAGPAVRALAAAPGDGALVADDGTGQSPVCARYPRAPALAAVAALLADDRRAARGLPGRLGAAVVRVPAGTLLNVNRPEDLAEAAARLRHPSGG